MPVLYSVGRTTCHPLSNRASNGRAEVSTSTTRLRPKSPRFLATRSAANAKATIFGIGGREVPDTILRRPAKLRADIGLVADKSLPIEGEAQATAATNWLAKVAGKPQLQHSSRSPAQITSHAAAPYEGRVRQRDQLRKT